MIAPKVCILAIITEQNTVRSSHGVRLVKAQRQQEVPEVFSYFEFAFVDEYDLARLWRSPRIGDCHEWGTCFEFEGLELA